jgi:hypothetical protein
LPRRENIAWEYNSDGFTATGLARAFVSGWRHSPEHRKNMLDGDLDEIGVGVARSQRTGRYYAVQDFGRPKSKAIVFRVTNQTNAAIHYTVDGQSFTLDPNYTATHTRCRPPEVEFANARGKREAAKEDEQVFDARNGDHFVIRGNGSGGYTVERQ